MTLSSSCIGSVRARTQSVARKWFSFLPSPYSPRQKHVHSRRAHRFSSRFSLAHKPSAVTFELSEVLFSNGRKCRWFASISTLLRFQHPHASRSASLIICRTNEFVTRASTGSFRPSFGFSVSFGGYGDLSLRAWLRRIDEQSMTKKRAGWTGRAPAINSGCGLVHISTSVRQRCVAAQFRMPRRVHEDLGFRSCLIDTRAHAIF